MTTNYREIHRHWAEVLRSNRDTGDPTYREEWYLEQCGGCRHWVPLGGALGEDWGACSNPASPFDGRVMFEHDGCEWFEADEDDDAPFA